MRIRFSDKQAVLGLFGHVGCGHSHSHNGYIQDDSVGLAVVLALLAEASGLDLTIEEVSCRTGVDGEIAVHTVGGGRAVCRPRRGVTVQEARLACGLRGKSAIRSQSLILETFGRFYGQGAHETPVALQAAVANAALDTFIANLPERIRSGREDLAGQCGLLAGTVLEIEGVPIGVVGTVNATEGGLGPVEDLEGNAALGDKKRLMDELGVAAIPSLVIEGKVYAKIFSDTIVEPTFIVRADPAADNPVIGAAVAKALESIGMPVSYRTDVLARAPGGIRKVTKALGEAVMAAGEQLRDAVYARDKVLALAELARLVSEDGAGVSFMSDDLHEVIGGVGMMPGTAAVLSLAVPRAYRDRYVFPFLTEEDLARYVQAVKAAVPAMAAVRESAMDHLRAGVTEKDINALVPFA